ncbi:MAG: class B sortase [Clostridiales bacterium]|nr:class B sortase [Clostridiales bacterium]
MQRLLLAAAGVLMVAAVALTINYLVQGRATRRVQEELRAQREAVATDAPVVEATETPTAEPAPVAAAVAQADPPPPSATPYPLPSASTAMLPEFLSFFRRNNDMAGWLKSDAFSDVDYPVVKRDNSYYVYRDFYGRDNMAGTVFIDADNSILPQDQNLILHGHNMKNGTMFGKLARLLERHVLLDAPFFQFSTLYDSQVYVPYAVSVVSIDPASPRYLSMIVPRFGSPQDQAGYVEGLRRFSAFTLPVEVGPNDRMLTMITCHGKEDSERLVVGLRALRPDENKESLKALLADQIITN